MNPQLGRKADHDHQAWVSATAFDAAEVGHIDLGVDRELFLAQAATLSKLQDIRANDGLPVHRENGRDNDYSHQGL
jgi:hypothetical protein